MPKGLSYYYCAKCRGHGAAEHEYGCPNEPDPVTRLLYRVDRLEDDLEAAVDRITELEAK